MFSPHSNQESKSIPLCAREYSYIFIALNFYKSSKNTKKIAAQRRICIAKIFQEAF